MKKTTRKRKIGAFVILAANARAMDRATSLEKFLSFSEISCHSHKYTLSCMRIFKVSTLVKGD